MGLGWNLNDNNGGSGDGQKVVFTKFPEGITRIRLLLEEGERPYMRWTHWMPQFSRKLTCAGFDCPIDEINRVAKANGQDAMYSTARSFSINIWNYDTGKHEVLEEGVTMIEALQDAIEEILEENHVANLNHLVLKVRKKKNSSGKFNWSVSLEGISDMEPKVVEAFNNRINFAEYFVPPTKEQVTQLLQVQAPTKDEYVQAYYDILGYSKKNEQ